MSLSSNDHGDCEIDLLTTSEGERQSDNGENHLVSSSQLHNFQNVTTGVTGSSSTQDQPSWLEIKPDNGGLKKSHKTYSKAMNTNKPSSASGVMKTSHPEPSHPDTPHPEPLTLAMSASESGDYTTEWVETYYSGMSVERPREQFIDVLPSPPTFGISDSFNKAPSPVNTPFKQSWVERHQENTGMLRQEMTPPDQSTLSLGSLRTPTKNKKASRRSGILQPLNSTVLFNKDPRTLPNFPAEISSIVLSDHGKKKRKLSHSHTSSLTTPPKSKNVPQSDAYVTVRKKKPVASQTNNKENMLATIDNVIEHNHTITGGKGDGQSRDSQNSKNDVEYENKYHQIFESSKHKLNLTSDSLTSRAKLRSAGNEEKYYLSKSKTKSRSNADEMTQELSQGRSRSRLKTLDDVSESDVSVSKVHTKVRDKMSVSSKGKSKSLSKIHHRTLSTSSGTKTKVTHENRKTASSRLDDSDSCDDDSSLNEVSSRNRTLSQCFVNLGKPVKHTHAAAKILTSSRIADESNTAPSFDIGLSTVMEASTNSLLPQAAMSRFVRSDEICAPSPSISHHDKTPVCHETPQAKATTGWMGWTKFLGRDVNLPTLPPDTRITTSNINIKDVPVDIITRMHGKRIPRNGVFLL